MQLVALARLDLGVKQVHLGLQDNQVTKDPGVRMEIQGPPGGKEIVGSQGIRVKPGHQGNLVVQASEGIQARGVKQDSPGSQVNQDSQVKYTYFMKSYFKSA